MKLALALALLLGSVPASAETIVVCAPGSPGATAEAQPAMDAFAKATAAKAGGAQLAAVYDETEDGGAKRLADAGIAMVSLPFYLKHGKELGLHARLFAVQKGRPALEKWTLVAKKGRVTKAAGLDGFTLSSNVAFAPGFVRGDVLGAWGALPASTKLVQTTQVLSALKRAANGDAVAVLLDGAQQAALASLPFADQLEVVATSPELPAGVVATIDARVSDKTWTPIEAALLGLRKDTAGAAALDGIRMDHFAAVDDKVLAAAAKAYAP